MIACASVCGLFGTWNLMCVCGLQAVAFCGTLPEHFLSCLGFPFLLVWNYPAMFARSFLVACAVNQSTWQEEVLRLLASVLLGVAAFVVGGFEFSAVRRTACVVSLPPPS